MLVQSQEEKNELKVENQRKAEEIKSLKTQLAQALEDNQKLKGGIFGKRLSYCSIGKYHRCAIDVVQHLFVRSPDWAAQGRSEHF